MMGTGGATSRTLTQTLETQSISQIQIKLASDYTRFPLPPSPLWNDMYVYIYIYIYIIIYIYILHE